MSDTYQLDLLAMADADERARQEETSGVPSLFTLRCSVIADYESAFEAWKDSWGSFGSFRASHSWTPGFGDRRNLERTPTCQPMVLHADLGCEHYGTPHCFCVGDLVYRGVCLACGWHSPLAADETDAALLALDHCYPGWRAEPIVPTPPHYAGPNGTREDAWAAAVAATVCGDRPHGWPIITRRGPEGHRAVPGCSPWKGYDVAAESIGR